MEMSQYPDGNIKISAFGLDIEIKSRYLLTETMCKESRQILDKLIEKELIKALKDFDESDENTDEMCTKLYQKEAFSERIKKIAIIERDLVYKLHSDGECIEMNEDLKEVRNWAHSVWKYDSQYGYVSTKKIFTQ